MTDTIKPTNSNSLEKLASLLATEDLVVEHANVPTASFDLKTRKVVLPMWGEMSKTLYHMLVLHEISHALNTPWDEFKEIVDNDVPDLKDYVNVIEDARIERKIKIKYPGSRRDFTEGYNDLHGRDFFGCETRDPNSLNLIDRINLFYKLGTRISVEFTEEEQRYVDAVGKTTTFSDVVSLAKELYGFAKEQAETSQDHDPEDENFYTYGQDEFDEAEEYGEEEDDDDSNEEGNVTTETIDSNKESVRGFGSDRHEGGRGLAASTVSEFERNMSEKMIDADDKRIPEYFDLNLSDLDYSDVVVDNKTFVSKYANRNLDKGDRLVLWNWFLKKNKNSVNYLVKEFEMKKAADMYARAKSDKTGKVDPNKLHNYKFSEDIFLRNTVLPGSKNHGLMMLVDLSGSMSENFFGSMQQLINLVMFCRRVGIAHRVYGFTDCWEKQGAYALQTPPNTSPWLTSIDTHGFRIDRDFKLIEFFHEKMNNQEFTFTSQRLLEAGFAHEFYWSTRKGPAELSGIHIPADHVIHLGGTPLNAALAYMRNMIRDFRKQTNSQIVNFVCVTDGGSNTLGAKWGIARDKETRLQSYFTRHSDQTKLLLSILKKTCGVHAINFFIANSRPFSLYSESYNVITKYRKEKNVTTHNWLGFDDVHTIWGGKKLHGDEVSIDDAKYIKKHILARTMIKMGNRRRSSRIVLSKFIDRIAA